MDQPTVPKSPAAAADSAGKAPSRFRALVRGNELGLIVVAIAIGAIAGLLAAAIGALAQALHVALFGIALDERLSGLSDLGSPWQIAVPAFGGVILGVILFALSRRKRQRAFVDPIEANALHGGRMSLTDSCIVVAQNLVSNGFGASVGLEAAYTQIGSSVGSRLGLAFELRRTDLRTLVGCGAAGAIAAAFNAPLTGAFYAFELVIGTYSIATLTPVAAAALAGSLASRVFVGPVPFVNVGAAQAVGAADYPPALVLAVLAAAAGIAIMQGVTATEAAFRKSRIPAALRPAIGGVLLAGLAYLTPQVLSAGHGAMHVTLDAHYAAVTLLALFALKATASAISIGSGFRGGLFFASLFLGSALGKLFALGIAALGIATAATPQIHAIVGMSALAVSIIGGPLTMTFLALEMTGDLPITALVLAAAVTASLTVRKTFGYSFATWRFHLRGESIRSAHDVGWIRTLSVGRMMRRDVRRTSIDTTLKVFRRDFPLGSAQRVVVTDRSEAYAGIVLVPDAYSETATDLDATVESIMRLRDFVLFPHMNAKEASQLFDASESEELAVVDDAGSRKVLGLLTEAHLLRRYSEELDIRRREAAGETT